MVTSWQIRKIHALKNSIGLDNDLYKEMLMSFGVQSSKFLTNTEATIFIDILQNHEKKATLERESKKRFSELRMRDSQMASPEQLRMLEALWREIAYFPDDDFVKVSLRKFLQNKFNVADVRFLTKKLAVRAIRAVINIKKFKGCKTLV